MGTYSSERAAERIARAAGKGFDLVEFWSEARDAIATVVPYYLTPCWYTLDPASLLATSHYDHGMIPQLPAEWLAHEYQQDDVHKLVDIARSQTGISTLHQATGGDPARSRRWHQYIRPYGGEQELLLALRTHTGETWACLRSTASPASASSTRQSSTSCAWYRRTSPKAPGAGS